MPVVILLWGATLSYAMAESGRFLMKHQKLTTLGALTGKDPVSATGGLTMAQAIGSVPSSGIAAATVAYARTALGKPYIYGAPSQCTANPKGYDCSGLVRCAVLAATAGGLNLPHFTVAQLAALSRYRVPKNKPGAWQPGDLLYYYIASDAPTEPGHCAIYIGGGQVIDAPHTGAKVRIDNYQLGPIMGVVRPALWSPLPQAAAAARTPAGAARR